MRLVTYKNEVAIDITNALLEDESVCKRLLSIYLDTQNQNTIQRYYDAYEVLRDKGHFDPNERAIWIHWCWASCFGLFLFFWYRKQYEMMVWSIVSMWIGFFPSVLLSGAFGYFAVLNGFALTIAKSIDKAMNKITFKEIKQKFKDDNLSDDEIVLKFSESVAQDACKQYGGVDNNAIIVVIVVAFLIYQYFN